MGEGEVPPPAKGNSSSGTWRSRGLLGFTLSLAIFVVPVAASVVGTLATAQLLPRAGGLGGTILWWSGVLAVSTLTLVAAERVTRRLLPLASLLKVTMVFPDRAPSRFAVAWRSATTRDLQRRLAAARDSPPTDADSAAAEILALAGALNLHDRRTRGHSERVRALTDMLADELKLPEADRDRLRWSALLHDIGKLHVHPDILNKDGPPTPEEWESLHRHPLAGAALIAPLKTWLGEWALTVEQHHEQHDGSGYPYGLSGEAISYGARIVAVADCFEVMTAMRSYKAPMSATDARQELVACSGTQFDPVIVRSFLNISIGKLRWTIGPLGWLSDLAFLRYFQNLPRLGQVVSGVAHQGVAAAVVAGGVVIAATTAASPAVLGHAPQRLATQGGRSAGAPCGSCLQTSSGLVAGHPKSSTTRGAATGAGATGSTTTSPPATVTPPQAGSPSTGGSIPPGGSTAPTAPTAPVTTTTSMPAAPPTGTGSLTLPNAAGAAGRADQGDTIVVVFPKPVAASALCSGWTSSSHPDLGGANVSIVALHPPSGDDQISAVQDSTDCASGFHFGTIDLGQSGFFNTTVTFGGSGPQCAGTATSGCSTIHWDGVNTLSIALGKPSGSDHADTNPSVASFMPDPALGLPGPILTSSSVQF